MKFNPIKLIYPQRCKYCNEVIDIRQQACKACVGALPRIEGKICSYCGSAVADCHCGHKKHFYKYICAPFYYSGPASNAIQLFKFCKIKGLAKPLAEDMAECFNQHYKDYDFDLCTFVPSAKADYKNRGFNQSELLTKAFCELVDLKFADLLEKKFQTQSQHMLNKIERSGNLVGAIDMKSDIDVENMRILLVDDIKTTGATLNECAKILLLNGAAEVFCITFAITDK